MWIYYLIPIVLHLIFLLFWFRNQNAEIALIEMFVGTIAVPIYLIIVSYKLLYHFSINSFLPMLSIILAVTILGIVISYFNWGITTGNLLKPDSGTIHLTKLQIMIASIIVIIGWTVTYNGSHFIGYQLIDTFESDEIIDGITICNKESDIYKKYILSKYDVDFDKSCILLTSYKAESVVKSRGFIRIYVKSEHQNNINVYLLNRPNLYFDEHYSPTTYVIKNN